MKILCVHSDWTIKGRRVIRKVLGHRGVIFFFDVDEISDQDFQLYEKRFDVIMCCDAAAGMRMAKIERPGGPLVISAPGIRGRDWIGAVRVSIKKILDIVETSSAENSRKDEQPPLH